MSFLKKHLMKTWNEPFHERPKLCAVRDPSNAHIQLPSGSGSLSEASSISPDSGETARLRMLAWAFAARTCIFTWADPKNEINEGWRVKMILWYPQVHINASANYHEVRATCEQTCTISGNRDSGTATWCCQTELCNDDENNLPVPNNNEASHLAGKLVALLLTGTMLLVSSSL